MNKYIKLLISIIVVQLAGVIGSLFTVTGANSWYASLNQPSFAPPNWLFGPVWITLYLLMGISLYLAWENKANLRIFFIQLVLNSLWTIFFFGLQFPLLGFIEIIILWIAILLTILEFYKTSKTAAYLLIPYILWVSFAAILNFGYLLLN
jgi:tryptophan-rich sensory protein